MGYASAQEQSCIELQEVRQFMRGKAYVKLADHPVFKHHFKLNNVVCLQRAKKGCSVHEYERSRKQRTRKAQRENAP